MIEAMFIRSGLVVAMIVAAVCSTAAADEFSSAWPRDIERTWIGPEYYADRLQDWRIRDGRLECVEAGERRPMRVVHLLTASVPGAAGTLNVSVRTGPIESGKAGDDGAWAGFLIGSGGDEIDYRLTALVHHRPATDGGLVAAIDGAGRLVFRDFEQTFSRGNTWAIAGKLHEKELAEIPATSREGGGLGKMPAEVELRLSATPSGDTYTLTLSAHNPTDGTAIAQATLDNVAPRLVEGGLGLVSHRGPVGSELGYWFRDWKAFGTKLTLHPTRTFGPILCSQYTLSRNTLKLTAQMPPLGAKDVQTAALQMRGGDKAWRTVARSRLVEHSHTFPFRVENWNAARDVEYRVVYELRKGDESSETHYWHGKIRKEPNDKEQFVVAAFTGNKHFTGGIQWNHEGVWFPHNELVAAIKYHDPDLLFFSGDQIYEGDLTGAQRKPADKAMLDYHDKWYRWCWAFRELTRDRPTVTIPDDHDVYHGNVWGAGGRHAKRQDDGGYTMPAAFVNMVQQTQTSHLPDPYDPTPVEQGIGVYYTRVEYAGVSFAVIEDRKFKSSPTVMVPEGKVVNGWFQNPEFDPVKGADVPGAVLLGERQLEFLRDWATDWSDGAWMKVVLSQTIFANVATLPRTAKSDGVVPGLKTFAPGEYAPDDKRVADTDSNGWPQSGRNRALREMRRGFAFHIAGDQHLGSFIRYGVDDWDDAGFALCVPSIANAFPRRWFPPKPGLDRKEGARRYTGQFLDGFGNHMTVHAVSNPIVSGHEPAALHDRVPGYGIVRLNRKTRDIVVECWPRWSNPGESGAEQYPGWPFTIKQSDNYAREAVAYLPTIKVTGMTNPVIRIIDQDSGEVVYAIRAVGDSFRPAVFREGAYTIEIGEPGTRRMRALRNIMAGKNTGGTIQIGF